MGVSWLFYFRYDVVISDRELVLINSRIITSYLNASLPLRFSFYHPPFLIYVCGDSWDLVHCYTLLVCTIIGVKATSVSATLLDTMVPDPSTAVTRGIQFSPFVTRRPIDRNFCFVLLCRASHRISRCWSPFNYIPSLLPHQDSSILVG